METRSGVLLQEARLRRKLKPEDVFRATGIPIRFLEALESGNFRIFGGRVYVTKYAKQYADFLELRAPDFFDAIQREWEIYAFRDAWRTAEPGRWEKMKRKLRLHETFILISLGIILPVGGYFFYQLSLLISAPGMKLEVPAEAMSYASQNPIVVRGRVKEQARLTANRRPVEIAGSGEFSHRLYLAHGLNRIEVEAVNVSGHKIQEIRYILYQPPISE